MTFYSLLGVSYATANGFASAVQLGSLFLLPFGSFEDPQVHDYITIHVFFLLPFGSFLSQVSTWLDLLEIGY